jgi:hypothetical protein
MPVSFAADIRPLFRDSPDIDSMQGYGLDLSSYEEVKARASEIYACLADGSMPCLNEDMLKNPYDDGLRQIVQRFAELLRPIIDGPGDWPSQIAYHRPPGRFKPLRCRGCLRQGAVFDASKQIG